MQVEQMEIAKLVADPSNARKHGQKNLEAIKGSLTKFKQQKPIVVDGNGVVVAGNGTLAAAKALGWESIAAVKTTLAGPDAIAFALADNRTAELAEWDLDNMGPILKSLQDINFDLGAIGFDEKDLAKLVPDEVKAGLCDDDEVPDVTNTRTKPGDLWHLGAHRLLCGDSTNVQHVERLMGGEKADMVLITDPPYGVNLGEHASANETRDRLQARKGYRSVEDSKENFTECVVPAIVQFLQLAKRGAVFGFAPNIWLYPAPKVLGGIFVPTGTGRNSWGWTNFMPILFYGSAPDVHKGNWPTVLNSNAHAEKVDHPTSKPVEWMTWLIDLAARESDVVIEPFSGSGSTLIACEKTGRKCFGMEIDPYYCDVILARWGKFTGKTASLISGEDSGDGKASTAGA